jgi:esterase
MSDLLSRYQSYKAPDGSLLAYRTGGLEQGVPVVLLHALAARTNTWSDFAAALIGAGRHVIVPDLRGHGRSVRVEQYPLGEFARDTIGLLDRLELPTADLVGHSLGGHVALTVAQQAPSRIRRLLIEDAPIPPRDEGEAEEQRRQRSKRGMLGTLGLAQSIAALFWRRFDLRMAKPTLIALRSPMPLWWDGLQSIHAETLLLGGTVSPIPVERLARLTATIPNARMTMLAGGHHLHSRHREAFLGVAFPFLNN